MSHMNTCFCDIRRKDGFGFTRRILDQHQHISCCRKSQLDPEAKVVKNRKKP